MERNFPRRFQVDMVLSGNARKNMQKLLRAADQSAHRSNLEILAAKPDKVLVLGHDLPVV